MGSEYSESGKWLKNHTKYEGWARSSVPGHPIFWLKGVVEVGKTSMICRIIEWRLDDLGANDEERIAFFYCSNKRGAPKGTEPRLVLSSLLRQLGWADNGNAVLPLVKDQKSDT